MNEELMIESVENGVEEVTNTLPKGKIGLGVAALALVAGGAAFAFKKLRGKKVHVIDQSGDAEEVEETSEVEVDKNEE